MTFQSVPLPDPVATLRAAHAAAVTLGVPIIISAGDTDFAAVQSSPLLAGLTGLHFVLQGGHASASLAAPAGIRVLVVSSVAYSWVLPRCSLVIHEGSGALTQAAMDAGIPNVIFPVFGDAFFWAARASTMGCAPPVYYPLRDLPDKLLEAASVARHPQVLERASAVGVSMRSTG